MPIAGVEISEQTECFGYVYMWYDTKRGKFYIGSHKGYIQDKYKSGSKWLNDVIKKRPESMRMRVLEYYYGDNRVELYKLEEKWLKFYDVQNNEIFYNFKNQARGGNGSFKHKGKKRAEYSPNWIDHRKGKTLEEIYTNPDVVRKRLAKTAPEYYKKYGHGCKKGKKHIKDARRGRTVEDIYGYRKLVNPDKSFNVTVTYPDSSHFIIKCLNEREFFEKTKMETNTLNVLKKLGNKKVLRRLEGVTRHPYPVGTVLRLELL